MFDQDLAEAGSVRVSDVFRFAAGSGVLEGETPVARFVRLADLLAANSGTLRWRMKGRLDAEGKPRLDLAASGRLMLRCQRCLSDLEWKLEIEAVLLPVRAGQDMPEDELENDEADVIELDGELDVLSLLEDEAILALPIAPRHADCGMPEATEADSGIRGQSPFAALAGLRGRGIL
ncbi:MAG: YceD family protein [Azoarcus sp.]|jgi:uncharacterized protein|nr:YceD family protein [Azoarcus sp.]